ncbi:S8 family peptidase [Methylobacterium radiotolerans]|uniref:S8 family peptidase n=1 Tax=Methylobacterium radiotolerans TaxID=31998 RepID=UPI0038D04D78
MDRAEHARILSEGLDAAVSDIDEYMAAQKASGVRKNKRGMPVTFEGRPDILLRVGQGRSSQGFALLNVRRKPVAGSDYEQKTDQATFFATPATLSTLRRNLEDYGNWVGSDDETSDEAYEDDTGRPRRFKLFESAALIRSTSVQDLWTDSLDRYPKRRDDFDWEVWTRADFQESFEQAVRALGLQFIGKPTPFVDTVVRGVTATHSQIQDIVRASAAVVGLRSASSFASDEQQFDLRVGTEALRRLIARVRWPGTGAPCVTLLDTGVRQDHPLLVGALPATRSFAVEPWWPTDDHHGHGTKMAGVTLYGDLAAVPQDDSPVQVETRLESVVVTAPPRMPRLPARDAIRRAVDAVEGGAVNPLRVYCLAQTAVGEAEDGLPTSTSGVLDQLAYGDGERTRLFCAAVGNVPHSSEEPYQLGYYADRNAQFGIQSPAQALNALSVGAVTLKRVREGSDAIVAPYGDLSPTSRTAQAWAKLHSYKPDIVMEGGNFLVDDDEFFCRPSLHHLPITTSKAVGTAPLGSVGETSAATAACAGLAGRLLARYPRLRMETVRALMVNAADWTPSMLAQHAATGDAATLLGRFGWGVPDERRLFESARNALTLMVEDTIEPYRHAGGGNIPLKEMKYFQLPWPKEALRALGRTRVEMRCTLSYFIEPDPHAAARDRIERYPSHRLKFDVKRYGEDHDQARARVNVLAEGGDASDATSDDGWFLGPASRNRGTLHHDIWTGPAFRLGDRDGISVLPVRGWWGDTTTFERYDRRVNFSLVVTIRTPDTDGVDLFAEVAAAINPSLLVEPVRATVQT